MGKFILKRLLMSILILFCVMLIVYTLMHCLPTNYIDTMARQLATRPGNTKSAQEWIAELNAQYGMDKAIWTPSQRLGLKKRGVPPPLGDMQVAGRQGGSSQLHLP